MTAWVAVVVIGIGTYLLRLSFIGVFGSTSMPPWAQRPLKYVGPAVLAALVAPAVVLREGGVDLAPSTNPRFLAAALAALVAWRVRSVAAVIVVGMVTLWLLQALV